MGNEVRWAFSPDHRSVLVVVDPVGVEAESVPDGFFFGSESPQFAVQMDSVWDVAPSPDWRMLAVGRAYIFAEGEADSVPTAKWDELARRTAIDVGTLRSSSFSASGMSYARGLAQPGIIAVPSDPKTAAAAPLRTFPIARGWRVRWTADGSTVALGGSPARVQDDEPSTSWTALDPRTGALHGSLPSTARLLETVWEKGPTLDISIPVDLTKAPPITVKSGGLNYIIESERGVISVRDPAFQTRAAIPVGPGVALAATAGGRYIVALAPRSKPVANDVPAEVVVYTVTF